MSYISNEILISLLKQYGIKKLVLSSGARNIPFVNAVEVDNDFECFSVIDERNAAFFGMGLSQQSNEPVAIACTSGTAASNYLTGVTEAFYSHVPLVVITFDRGPYMLNQLETQKVDQPAIFYSVCKKSVSLPIIKDSDDIWYCQRLVNEALITLTQNYTAPVHINVPLIGGQNDLVDASITYKKADKVNKIEYVASEHNSIWEHMADKLFKTKRVLFVMGQTANMDGETISAMNQFFNAAGYPLLLDNLANYRCDSVIFAEAVIKALNSKTATKFMPDIIVTFGNNFQERIKDIFKAHQGEFEHWSIEPEGVVKDVFKSQTALFDCTPKSFFSKMLKKKPEQLTVSNDYYESWKKLENSITLPDMPFTNFYVVREFSKVLPKNSILHLSILNSTRLMQFFDLDESIKVYSNVNSFGIDGCLPTFMGQAYLTDELAFMLSGDLSFFYGMNAAAIKHRKKNIRILVVNNGGGAEFHIMPDSNAIPTIDMHIGAAHDRSVKGWVESMGYKYLTANDEASFANSLQSFVSKEHDKPIVFEVFTDMKQDGEHLLSVYRAVEKCILPLVN